MTATEIRTVSREQIEAEIASEHCFTAAEGQAGAVGRPRADVKHIPAALDALTICVLVLKNGAKVVGINYGAIDPTIHSAELGREDARQDARNKVRDYLGFRLRDQIAAEQGAAPAAKRYTRDDVRTYVVADNVMNWAIDVHLVMNDGKEFDHSASLLSVDMTTSATAWERHEVAIKAALRVANGEAP